MKSRNRGGNGAGRRLATETGPERGRRSGPFRIVRENPSLVRLIGAFAAVNVAEWGYVTAFSVDAFRHDGTLGVGLVGLRLFLAAASSFLSTSLVDRFRPGRILVAVATVRAVFLAISATLVALGVPFDLLFALLAVDAIASGPYRPAQSAVIAGVSRSPRELVAAAAGTSTVKTLSQAIGAVAGGVLLAIATPVVAFSAAGGIFLLAAAIVLPYWVGGSNRMERRRSRGVWRLIRETAMVVNNPNVGTILVVSGLRTFVRGMWVAIAVIASLRLLHAGSAGVGLLMLAGGVGSLIAAPLSGRLITRNRIGTPAAIALVGCGAPLALIAGIPVFDMALALIGAWGIGMAVADVATSSLLNRLLETPALPRVTSAIEATKLGLEGLGAFLAPLLTEVIGVRGALLVAAFPLPCVVATRWRTLHRVDSSAGERSQLLEVLHQVPSLELLDMASLDSLIGRLTPMYVPATGVDVVRQHDRGDRFYVVEFGEADVLVDGFVVGRVGPGGSFGERALLRDVARTATVRSRGTMQLLVLPRADFLEALTGQEDGSIEWDYSGSPAVTAGWDRQARVRMLSNLNLFSHLDHQTLDTLARGSEVQHWADGELIIRQGDEAAHFYVLLQGRAAVCIDGEQVNELRGGDQFGEIALMHGVPRSADVAALGPVVTLSLGRESFLPAIRERFLAG